MVLTNTFDSLSFVTGIIILINNEMLYLDMKTASIAEKTLPVLENCFFLQNSLHFSPYGAPEKAIYRLIYFHQSLQYVDVVYSIVHRKCMKVRELFSSKRKFHKMNSLFYISEKVTTVLALGVRALNVAFILIDQKNNSC